LVAFPQGINIAGDWKEGVKNVFVGLPRSKEVTVLDKIHKYENFYLKFY
jgi:hypothetical protein